jgi:Holliday junction resolvase
MTDASARGRSNRNRGAAAERELARWIRDELGIEVSRNLKQYQRTQEGDLTPLGPFLLEVKYHARINVRDWWRQAVAASKVHGLIPVVAYKVARRGWRFVLPHADSRCGGTLGLDGENWSYDYEYTMDVGPACFALIVRESL